MRAWADCATCGSYCRLHEEADKYNVAPQTRLQVSTNIKHQSPVQVEPHSSESCRGTTDCIWGSTAAFRVGLHGFGIGALKVGSSFLTASDGGVRF